MYTECNIEEIGKQKKEENSSRSCCNEYRHCPSPNCNDLVNEIPEARANDIGSRKNSNVKIHPFLSLNALQMI